MNIKRVIILIVIIFSICTYMVFYALRDNSETKIDIVAVNDITQSLTKQWDRLGQAELPCLQYGLDYVVMDNGNNFITATRNGLNTDINSAISNRDTIVDIKLDNKVLGKLIINNNTSKIMQQYRKYLITFFTSLMIFITMLCVSYVVYIDRTIFCPFRKLQGFARHVAEGKLDMPLEMDKDNMFGAFTESFDLMRAEQGKGQ